MYGLVNQAIEAMVRKNFSSQIWDEIHQKAAIQDPHFLSMAAYPDDVTHRLVKAASEVLNLSSGEIMRAFGSFWVEYVDEHGYAELMEMSGESLPEFLQNLDELHARVGLSFPKLRPPSFECRTGDESIAENTDQNTSTLCLDYRSEREGLAPMVIGLVEGLGKRFDTSVEVTQTQIQSADSDCDTFLIQYRPQD